MERVELHYHTKMSALDGVISPMDLIRRAAEYGHKAVVITDHGVVQSFPEAQKTAANMGMKVIYGVEVFFPFDHKTPYLSPRLTLNI